ncbi:MULTISPECIES: hypothetical protein [Streptomyces]|uniref:Integral membrane protein n=1 Tax=Streptomyces edwardsiae TaxID=3075527 RepID=A0ABU2QFC1_9ACTN|nr:MULTISPECIES: hypothetical protein [unclassified Streptomyces]MDT0401685.1 hypothetical protein [Streptomyces sp. DSM 41635]
MTAAFRHRYSPVALWLRYSPAALWRRCLSGLRTRRLLELHLVMLLVLTAVAATALFLSGRQAQRSADALAAREAPAVQGLAASRLAALRADEEIARLVKKKLIGVAGSGEAYRSQLSAADQGLSRIADRTDQDLGTIKGLLATYSDSLARGTSLYRDDPLMRTQRLRQAKSLLTREKVGVAPRLKELQGRQLRHAEATAAMGWWQHAGWWTAEIALSGAVLTLLSALFVLRDRCGRDWNPYLLAALVLTVLLAVVPLMTAYSTQGELDGVLEDLRQITEVSWQGGATEAAQRNVTEMSEEVRRQLAGGTWTESVYRGALVGSLLAVVLPVLGLGLRLDRDYWRRW